MKRPAIVGLVVLAGGLFVSSQVAETLRTLETVEHERDTWQRPAEILDALDLVAGTTVVDLGSGAGYFSLKLAARVAPGGRVLAIDLRRQSLAFLWLRAKRAGHSHLQVIRGTAENPRLPGRPVDAVLIANTYHELEQPAEILDALFAAMRPGARLVVVDHESRADEQSDASRHLLHHHIEVDEAEHQIAAHGFQVVSRDARFIDRSGDSDVWWLMVFRKP